MAAYNWQNVNVGNPNAGSPYAAYATQLKNSMTDPIMKAINSMQTVAQANAEATNKKDMFEKELKLAKENQKMNEAYKNAQIASLKQAMKQDNLPWVEKEKIKTALRIAEAKRKAELGILSGSKKGSSGGKSGNKLSDVNNYLTTKKNIAESLNLDEGSADLLTRTMYEQSAAGGDPMEVIDYTQQNMDKNWLGPLGDNDLPYSGSYFGLFGDDEKKFREGVREYWAKKHNIKPKP